MGRGGPGTTESESAQYKEKSSSRQSFNISFSRQAVSDESSRGKRAERRDESRLGADSVCGLEARSNGRTIGSGLFAEAESDTCCRLFSRLKRPAHIPPSVWDKLDRRLYKRPDNPIGIVKKHIESFFLRENKRLSPPEEGEDNPTFFFPSSAVLHRLSGVLYDARLRTELRCASAFDGGPPCDPVSALASSSSFGPALSSSSADVASSTPFSRLARPRSPLSSLWPSPAASSLPVSAEKIHCPTEPGLRVPLYQLFDEFSPIVTCHQNFDSLLVPFTHVSRQPSDTYYLEQHSTSATGDERKDSASAGCCPRLSLSRQPGDLQPYDPSRLLLRTHGTAHQKLLIDAGVKAAIWTVDVVRRDEIDRLHYPVFHQTDGFRLFSPPELRQLQVEHALLLALLPRLIVLARDRPAAPELRSQAQDTKRVALSTGSLSGKIDLQAKPANGLLSERLVERTARDGVAAVRNHAEDLEWISQSPALLQPNPLLGNPVILHLQLILERLVRYLLGPHIQLKWDYDTSFPFTDPSVELYVATAPPSVDGESPQPATQGPDNQGTAAADGGVGAEWVEVLGAGEIRSAILGAANAASENIGVAETGTGVGSASTQIRGWAFGLGLERLCMRLFGIDDIRLFWSTDSRFTDQFADGQVRQFLPFSSMPPVYKDISFWVNAVQWGGLPSAPDAEQSQERNRMSDASRCAEVAQGCANEDTLPPLKNTCPPVAGAGRVAFSEMSFYELCREVGGDLVESVKLVDSFVHPKTGRRSVCYRLTYRALDRTLTHQEVNAVQETVYRRIGQTFDVELR